jgi:hypothetical protein
MTARLPPSLRARRGGIRGPAVYEAERKDAFVSRAERFVNGKLPFADVRESMDKPGVGSYTPFVSAADTRPTVKRTAGR